MNAPPERALPLLKKVLASQHSLQTKKRALFVLSQLGSDAALDVVLDTAKNSSDMELRAEAIRMLGVSGENRAIERLREIYATSKDAHEKSQIIEAWLIADRKDLVLASARTEADPSVRAKAIERSARSMRPTSSSSCSTRRRTPRTGGRSSRRSASPGTRTVWQRSRVTRSCPTTCASRRCIRSASPAPTTSWSHSTRRRTRPRCAKRRCKAC